MMKASPATIACVLALLVFLAPGGLSAGPDTGEEDLASLVAAVRALDLGEGGYRIGAALTKSDIQRFCEFYQGVMIFEVNSPGDSNTAQNAIESATVQQVITEFFRNPAGYCPLPGTTRPIDSDNRHFLPQLTGTLGTDCCSTRRPVSLARLTKFGKDVATFAQFLIFIGASLRNPARANAMAIR